MGIDCNINLNKSSELGTLDPSPIKAEMDKRGWKVPRLAKESGASQQSIYRFFHNDGISGVNYDKLLDYFQMKGADKSDKQKVQAAEPGPSQWDYIRSLEKRLDDQTVILASLNERIEGMRVRHVDALATANDRINSLSDLVRTINSALIQAEKQKDFLPLKTLSGRK